MDPSQELQGYESQPLGYQPNQGSETAYAIWGAVSVAATGASAYHGYKRNDSVGWAIWWGLMGALFPVITIPVAIAQGFGERAS